MRIELDEILAAQLHAEDSKVAQLFIARLNPRDEGVTGNALAPLLRDGAIPADLRAYYVPAAASRTVNIIGIDPGVETGFAVWDEVSRTLKEVATLKIHEAMQKVLELQPTMVIFEDARQRNWFGGRDAKQRKFGAGVREGAGSVKRDCTIWEDFLKGLDIPYIAKAPAAKATKWSAEKFKSATGWSGRTSGHARDAAVLVIGVSSTQLQILKHKSELRVETLRKCRATRKCRRKAAAEFAARLTAEAQLRENEASATDLDAAA